MKWAALIAWMITAGGGFVLLSIWLMRGGMRQQQEAGNRIRPPLILSHFLLAAGGLVVWIVYLVADKSIWSQTRMRSPGSPSRSSSSSLSSAGRCSQSGFGAGRPEPAAPRWRRPAFPPSSTFPSRS